MGNVLAKLGQFFETHVEKIVLVVAGLLGLWLVFVRVLFSPNVIEFNNETFSPKTIDPHLVEEYAKPLRVRLAGPADPGSAYPSPLHGPLDPNDPVREGINADWAKGFLDLFGGPLQHVSTAYYPPLPRDGAAETQERREYALPTIDEVTDVRVGHIRAAAYFPLTEVSEDNPYDSAQHEPNDLDLVTVQGTYNFAMLRDRFFDSFAGEDLPETWRDEDYAKPVFAAVQLQRQQQADDGTWSDWQDVPRLAIEHRQELLQVITKAEDLPAGGVRLRSLELNDEEIRTALLQPTAYDIASAHEDWFPPSLHDEFLEMRKKEIAFKKREERQAEKEARTNDNSNNRESRRGQARAAGGRGGGQQDMYGMYGAEGGGNTRRRGGRGGNTAYDQTGTAGGRSRIRSSRGGRAGGRSSEDDMLYYEMMGMGSERGTARNQPSVDEVYEKLEELKLSPFEEFYELDELTFWAHDDRLEPAQTYRYRIRIGVLNPVAGTDNVRDADMPRVKDVILWSPFSEVTSSVYVPHRLRFFAKDYKETTETVKVDVAKYDMGYWNIETFSVKPGEMIGHEVEVEEEVDPLMAAMDREMRMMQMEMQMYGNPLAANLGPESVDYTTGAVLVGAVRVDGWAPGSNLRAQISHDMLYTADGRAIERTPIASASWTNDIASSFGRIRSLSNMEREDFRDFGASPAKRGRSNRSRSGAEGLYPEMMMEY